MSKTTNSNQQIADEQKRQRLKRMNIPTNLKDFTIYWDSFREEMLLRMDILFDDMWKEINHKPMDNNLREDPKPLTLKDIVQKDLSPEAEAAIKKALQEAHDDQVNLHESVKNKDWLDEIFPCDCAFTKGFAFKEGDPCDGTCVLAPYKKKVQSYIDANYVAKSSRNHDKSICGCEMCEFHTTAKEKYGVLPKVKPAEKLYGDIKECLEDVANFYSNRELTLDGEDYKGVDDALAEIRQLLKECEPTTPNHNVFDKVSGDAYKAAVSKYTANIEKRLG